MVRDVRLGNRDRPIPEAKTGIPEGFLDKSEASHSVRGYFKGVRGKAIVFQANSGLRRQADEFLPLSQVHIKQISGTEVEVYMKAWLYREKFC